MAPGPEAATLFVLFAGGCGAVFAGWQARKVYAYRGEKSTAGFSQDFDETHAIMSSQESKAAGGDLHDPQDDREDRRRYNRLTWAASQIKTGAKEFLRREYMYIFVFLALFSLVVFGLVGSGSGNYARGFASTVSFLAGGLTSILCGYIGMSIAVEANWRTTLAACVNISKPFRIAFRAGAVMGFALTSFGLLVMFGLICLMNSFYSYTDDADVLFEVVAGYGLGGSTVALFGRVGGGIYTKAADVGADLAGKIGAGLDEDDPRNPGVIADNVGDNVGDIAGMGADLFGSFAEATSAALVVAASSAELRAGWTPLMFPLAISAAGILVGIVTSFLATNFMRITHEPEIERTLKMQLIASTALMTPVVYFIAEWFLPADFCVKALSASGMCPMSSPFEAFMCVLVGLWVGLFIGLVTEYFTSHSFRNGPVREVADACKSSAATNIIFGLALGYESCIVPVIMLAGTIFLSFKMCGMYGIALAALGMLSTLSLGLTIDAYGPVADNAGGVAEIAEYPKHVRKVTDALDSAGNTTAAIGKGFAIGSAALVSLALFGAFVTRTGVQHKGVNILQPVTFAGLLFGSMLPYWFSALTMKSVGSAALKMVEEITAQWQLKGGIEAVLKDPDYVPNYARCIKISTDASLREMLKPGALTILTPIIVGWLFGVHAVTGTLAGALVSGVQMAISASNSGGAWDNAKKYIGTKGQRDNNTPTDTELFKTEGGWAFADNQDRCIHAPDETRDPGFHGGVVVDASGRIQPKMVWKPKLNTAAYENAVTGDTVGDPLKDTSGPSLNILMKLMAIVSLVFAEFFVKHSLNLGVSEADSE